MNWSTKIHNWIEQDLNRFLFGCIGIREIIDSCFFSSAFVFFSSYQIKMLFFLLIHTLKSLGRTPAGCPRMTNRRELSLRKL